MQNTTLLVSFHIQRFLQVVSNVSKLIEILLFELSVFIKSNTPLDKGEKYEFCKKERVKCICKSIDQCPPAPFARVYIRRYSFLFVNLMPVQGPFCPIIQADVGHMWILWITSWLL